VVTENAGFYSADRQHRGGIAGVRGWRTHSHPDLITRLNDTLSGREWTAIDAVFSAATDRDRYRHISGNGDWIGDLNARWNGTGDRDKSALQHRLGSRRHRKRGIDAANSHYRGRSRVVGGGSGDLHPDLVTGLNDTRGGRERPSVDAVERPVADCDRQQESLCRSR
jgi:hypothetical protein